jgi:aspartate/methionine/tyrosine aminotransferase
MLSSHPSRELSERARDTPGALDLTVGEPYYGPPARVIHSLAGGLAGAPGRPSSYAPAAGEPALRRSIARYVRRVAGADVDPAAEVLVTIGAAEALWLAVFTLTRPGDEVLLPDPAYSLYELVVLALDRRPVRVPTSAGSGFALPVDAVRREATERSRLLIINSPGNPTGAVYDAAAIQALADYTREAGLCLLHDEVLDFATFDGRHASALGVCGGRDHVVSINSFSKRFGLPGWRVGWLVARPGVVDQAAKAHTLFALATPAPLQAALSDALDDPAVERECRAHVANLEAAAREAGRAWQACGFASAAPPRAGFYLFLHAGAFCETRLDEQLRRSLAPRIAGREFGEVAAEALFERTGVAVVPGTAFGAAGRELVRINCAGAPRTMQEAIARITDYCGSRGLQGGAS